MSLSLNAEIAMDGDVPEGRDLVVLLDEAGSPTGTYSRMDVHGEQTPLHLAFSTYLVDDAGRVLLTRRALNKVTWPGVWTNSCCGHPRPGEDIREAARRRITEELGVHVGELVEVLPHFRYRARDASGIVENEICPVFVGRIGSAALSPDPDEVMETAWVDWSALVGSVFATPQVFSPWSVSQVDELGRTFPHRLPGSDPRAAARTLAECNADVDALLRSELDSVAGLWDTFNAGEGVEILPDDLPGWLDGLLQGRGKRLRVAMAYWGYLAAGGELRGTSYDNLVRIGAALETLHLFALIHDDVMDRSTSRRGRPAAHIEAAIWFDQRRGRGDADLFGQNLAILLGDLAHTIADRMVDSLPKELRTLWYELCIELMTGQRADLTGAAAGRRDVAHADHIARLKSGCYTIERPLQLGATAAGADESTRRQLVRYGRHVGRAFALRDDQLGIWGDPATTGKPSGDDLAEGKATVIMALASDRLSDTSAAGALRRLGTAQLESRDVGIVRSAIEAAGIPADIEAMIADEVASADCVLDSSQLDAAGVAGLKQAARSIAWRNS